MVWNIPRIWEDGRAWIIGGGPSLPRVFGVPEDIIAQVNGGSLPPTVYSPYMKVIHKEHTIGVNMAYRLGDWVDVVIFGDSGFYLSERVGLAGFKGLRVSCNSHSTNDKWIKYVERDNEKSRGITTKKNRVSWNANTGAAAINLAVQMGVKQILLLGFDMTIGSDRMQHWHNLYKKGPLPLEGRRVRGMPFQKHLSYFTHVANDARRLGIEIINVSPYSKIDLFPKVTLEEALKYIKL